MVAGLGDSNMVNILLVLSTTRESPRTIDYAFKRVQELKGNLVALCVIDTSLAASIQEKLADSAFIGDKPGEDVYQKILEEYKQRGERKLKEIEDAAQKHHISIKTILREGDIVKECLDTIDQVKAFAVIIGRKKRSKLSQFIFGSPIKLIEKNAKCPVEVIEE